MSEKLLPFEGRYRLETSPCPRCDGSGLFAHPARNLSPNCMNCRGLGRKASAAGLKLFYLVCEQLGRPMSKEIRESRIEPKHLDSIWARDVTVGMHVAAVTRGSARDWPEQVTTLDPLPGENNRRFHFSDGRMQNVSAYTLMHRVLSVEEIAAAQALLADHLGNGAVEVAS